MRCNEDLQDRVRRRKVGEVEEEERKNIIAWIVEGTKIGVGFPE